MTSSRPDIRVDESGRLGNYRILRPLGRGGMGDVYLAWTGLRLVAVKILHANFASDQTFVEMFLAEARVAGRINHSSIAQVLDVGMDGGRLYMVMEYVAGHTLDDLISDETIRSARPLTEVGEEEGDGDTKVSEESPDAGPSLFPLRIAVSVFAQVAHALAAAHRAQVVHRDISPHNILVSDTGAIKLIDFGIARTQNEDARTTPGTFRGRFGYMAPEYIQGRPCDHRVDLFALGVVMWETFTRRRLYPGAAAAQLYAVIERPAPRLDAVIQDFPLLLADVVERLLEREPDDRYDNAVEVAQTLEKLLPALPDGGFRNLAHWTERHLSARIDARARADHDDLQVVVEEEAAEQASYEPEIELRSGTGSHLGGRAGRQTGSQSQAGAWPAPTVASRLPPKLAFGLGMAAAALVAGAAALWILVARQPPPVAPAQAVVVSATEDAGASPSSSLAPVSAQAPPGAAGVDASPSSEVPPIPLEPPKAAADPELEIEESAATDAVEPDGDGDGKRAQKRRDAERERKEAANRGRKEPAVEPAQAQARTVEPPKPAEPAPVAAAEPVPAKPAVTTSIPQLAPPPPPVPSGPPRTPRVPATLVGDAGRGGTVLGQCNACHTENKKKRIDGKHMTRSQWERFFRNGSHDRYRPLGDRLSVNELAAAKAYLMGRALDASEDQSAGVR
jgi:eukaryotic-like serine/threonine-protein kinase